MADAVGRSGAFYCVTLVRALISALFENWEDVVKGVGVISYCLNQCFDGAAWHFKRIEQQCYRVVH